MHWSIKCPPISSKKWYWFGEGIRCKHSINCLLHILLEILLFFSLFLSLERIKNEREGKISLCQSYRSSSDSSQDSLTPRDIFMVFNNQSLSVWVLLGLKVETCTTTTALCALRKHSKRVVLEFGCKSFFKCPLIELFIVFYYYLFFKKDLFFCFFQLYEIDDNPKRKEFLDELFSLMQKRGKFEQATPRLQLFQWWWWWFVFSSLHICCLISFFKEKKGGCILHLIIQQVQGSKNWR